MVRGLHEENPAAHRIVGWDDEATRRFAKAARLEHRLERGPQHVVRVLRSGESLLELSADALREARARKDRWPLRGIEVADLAWRYSEPEAYCDDAAGGCAGDQIEMIDDAAPQVLLERGEHRGREGAFNAAAVDAQDSEHASPM